MKAYVRSIKPHHAGFGQYESSCDETKIDGDFSTIEEYADLAMQTSSNLYSYAIDPDIADAGDADGQAMAEALRAATGSVLGGHDTLVAFCLGKTPYGKFEIILESVRLAPTVAISHERFGETTQFDSIEEALDSIRDMGEEFEDVKLEARGEQIVDNRGEVVGRLVF